MNALKIYDLILHLHRQRRFSREAFGPHPRLDGVLAHIRKELKEIAAKPNDLEEWIDVVLLAFDGAWRAGHEPEAIAAALEAKQAKNESRTWPDWRTAGDGPIEHDRTADEKKIDPLSVRITLAISRITSGHGAMRIPADETDPDLVLGACRDRIAELEEWKANAEAGLAALRQQVIDLDAQVADLVTSANSTTSGG